jgi:hypothetical protein
MRFALAVCHLTKERTCVRRSSSWPQSPVNTPSTPANASGGASASREEQKEGANPVQGQVDPKDSVQQRDFQQRGDGAGPKGPDTEPKQGK